MTSKNMYTVMQNFFGDMISQGRNAQRENLLHYVCHLNESGLMRSLLQQGCHLCEQDIQGRTPVHVAIEQGHQECVTVFLNLLKCYHRFNETIQRDLCRLFQVYNNKGHTILHEAALRNMEDVVKDMLSFCCDNNLNVAENEVLGCGDHLLHLVVQKNLPQMAKIICDFLPQLVKCGNYAGILPQDLSCITEEMKRVLSFNNDT